MQADVADISPGWDVGYRAKPLPAWVRAPWKAGEAFAQTEMQAAFHASEARVKILSGGFGSTKSHTLCMEAIFCALENDGRSQVVIVSPTGTLSEDTIERRLRECLEECGLREGIEWTIRESKPKNVFLFGGLKRGGSTIMLRSAEAAEQTGYEVAAVFIDEPAGIPERVYKSLRRRCRDPRAATEPLFVLTGTPNIGSWFARLVADPPPGAEVFHASTDGNPFARTEYLVDLETDYDERTLEALRHGRVVAAAGGGYYSFSNAPWPDGNIAACHYDPELPLYITTDNNTNPKPAVLFHLVGGQMRCFDEIKMYGAAWGPLAEMVHARVGGVKPSGIGLHGDATDRHLTPKSDSEAWGGYGDFRDELVRVFGGGINVQLLVPNGNPLELSRVSTVNGWLRNAAGTRRLVVDPRCVDLIADFEGVQIDDNGRVRKPGRRGGEGMDREMTGPSDAIGYACHAESVRRSQSRGRPVLVGADFSLR